MTNTQYALIILLIFAHNLNGGPWGLYDEDAKPPSDMKEFHIARANPNKETLSQALILHEGEVYFERFEQLVEMSKGIVNFNEPIYYPYSSQYELLLIHMMKNGNCRHVLCLIQAGAKNIKFNEETPLQVAQAKLAKLKEPPFAFSEMYRENETNLLEEVIKKLSDSMPEEKI